MKRGEPGRWPAGQLKIFFVLIFALILSACNGLKVNDSDGWCKIVDDKAGDTIKTYDFISISYSLKTQEGKVIASTGIFDNRPQLHFRTPPHFKNDLNTALGKLSEGDSAIVIVPLDTLVARMHYQRPVTKSKYLFYYLRVNKVITRGRMSDSMLNSKIEQLKQDEVYKAKVAEPAKISRYINVRNIHPQHFSSGLQYVVEQKGSGRKARPGDVLLVNYDISSLDGKVFDTNIETVAKAAGRFIPGKKYQPFETPITKVNKPGFQQYSAMMAIGEKTTFIVPSNLAYGNGGNMLIEPYTPLLFKLQVIGVSTKKHSKVKDESGTKTAGPIINHI